MRIRTCLRALATALPCAGFAVAAHASVFGTLGNFDVVNDTGSVAHGFEIELEDLHLGDISDTFGGVGRGFPSGRGFDPQLAVQRYGAPTVTEYDAGGGIFGVRVTYRGLFDPATMRWDFGTPSGNQVTPGDNCWTGGGIGYGPATSCDHFGVGTRKTPTRTTYSWLLETAPDSADLTKGGVVLPAPVWQVIPNAQVPAGPPRVIARIEAPEPPHAAEFGDAIWVKVFTTEIEREVGLEDLIGGNPVIEQVQTEIEWQLVQKEFNNPNSGFVEVDREAGGNAAAIVRRYEFFAYAGTYDENHEAKVIMDNGFGDSNPAPGDLGAYLGAQNGAVNLAAVAPIPEPQTYAMLLAGLLMVTGIVRRRRRSTLSALDRP